MPSPYPTNFPSRFPTKFPTAPTLHPTYIYSPNYVLLRRNAICDGADTNVGIKNLDDCWKACVNSSTLFVFGNQEGSKCEALPSEDCVCRCESGQDSDALDCYRWVPNGNFDLFRIIDVPPPIRTRTPTSLPTSLPSNLPSEYPTWLPSIYPTDHPTDITLQPTWLPSRGCECPKVNCTAVHCAPHKICPTCATCAEESSYKVFSFILTCLMGCGAIIYGIQRIRKKWRNKRVRLSPPTIAMTRLNRGMESLHLPPRDSMMIGIDISGN